MFDGFDWCSLCNLCLSLFMSVSKQTKIEFASVLSRFDFQKGDNWCSHLNEGSLEIVRVSKTSRVTAIRVVRLSDNLVRERVHNEQENTLE